jgi:hypothetical protein
MMGASGKLRSGNIKMAHMPVGSISLELEAEEVRRASFNVGCVFAY